MGFSLTILGCRGSVPVHGSDTIRYGGGTTCYRIDADEQVIFVDAGSGIMGTDLESLKGKGVSVLFTHPHLDHLIGLPFFAALSDPDREIHVYGAIRNGRNLKEQLDDLLRPPYWPLGISSYPAEVRWHGTDQDITIGSVRVSAMEVPHPGGSTAYRLTLGDRSVVIMTDAELPETPGGEILDFIAGADLFLCDGQYTPEESEKRRGYGHTAMPVAAAWAEAAQVRRALLVHHDPKHDDLFLDAMADRIGSARVGFAKAGECHEIGEA